MTGVTTLPGGTTDVGTGSGGETGSAGETGSPTSGVGGDDPECPWEDGAADMDADGLGNAADDCACEANPAQLDFDEDGLGNVCDSPLLCSELDGTPADNVLSTVVRASAKGTVLGVEIEASCEFQLEFPLSDGEMLVKLDDAGHAKSWIAQLSFEDTTVQKCSMQSLGVTLVDLDVRMRDFYAEGLVPYVSAFAFTTEEHEAGEIGGMVGTWDIGISGVFEVVSSSNEAIAAPGETVHMQTPGKFAPARVDVHEHGAKIAVKWSDQSYVLFDQVVSASGVRVTLTGMQGTLKLTR